MEEKQHLILSPQEAVDAVCLDLQRYEPQTILCAELLRILFNDDAVVKRDPTRNGLWIRNAQPGKMRFYSGTDLIGFVCKTLVDTPLPPREVAGICRRVFQTPVTALPSGDGEGTNIRIETGMEGFSCRLCGHCCRDLDYHREVSFADVTRWQAQGRNDILKWVGMTKGSDQKPAYRIWVIPGTNQFAPTCPFLKRGPSSAQWVCAIQETKPDICRHYPASRKHAAMTGCLGFSSK